MVEDHPIPRVLGTAVDDSKRLAYNDNIVAQLEKLLLLKGEQIPHQQPTEAIRTAIACMTAMLRDAIIFEDTSLYSKPRNMTGISSQIANVVYAYLVVEAP